MGQVVWSICLNWMWMCVNPKWPKSTWSVLGTHYIIMLEMGQVSLAHFIHHIFSFKLIESAYSRKLLMTETHFNKSRILSPFWIFFNNLVGQVTLFTISLWRTLKKNCFFHIFPSLEDWEWVMICSSERPLRARCIIRKCILSMID